MYYVYVLRSKRDGKLYIGFTQDLRKRLKKHNQEEVGSTKYRAPLDLVYYEASLSKSKTLKRERYFKTGFGRRFLVSRI